MTGEINSVDNIIMISFKRKDNAKMKIVIDLHEQTLSSVVSDGVFYAQTETTIDITTQGGEGGVLNGVSCALLAPDGVTLAHSIASENKAVLNTNTEECVKFVEGSSIDSEKIAFLAIGDSDKPLAILPVAVKRNPLAEVAPPSELAPTYPTSESLLAILSQMTAQAQRAGEAAEATETAQKAVAEYVDVTFPTKVEQAEESLANATTEGVQAVTDKATQSVNSITSYTSTIIGALDTKKTQIESSIDGKAQAVNNALDGKITSATTAIDGKVTEANEVKDNAVKAKDDAVTAKGQAEGFAKDAGESAEQASKSAKQAEDAKNAIGDVGERFEAIEKVANNALPMGLGDWSAYNNKAYDGNVLGKIKLIPAPQGFIFVHGTLAPYASMRVEWIKPNGERVFLATSSTTKHPWMSYSGTIYCGWMDCETVYVYAKSPAGAFYRASILFVDGVPSFDTMESTEVATVANPIDAQTEYCIALGNGYLITNRGEIFSESTLEKASSVSLQVYRIVKPSSGEGVLARTSSAVVRITIDFDDEGKPTPVTTNVNTYAGLHPLSSGYICARSTQTYQTSYTRLIACGGGTSISCNRPTEGNVIPVIVCADLGDIVATPYGLFSPQAEGTSTSAVGFNNHLVLFANPLYANNASASSVAVKSGDAYIIYSSGKYVLVSKEELV